MSSRFSISSNVLAGTGIGPVSAVSHAGSAISRMRGGRTVASLGRVSRPVPDEAILFDDREGTQPSLSWNVTIRVRRHSDALAGRVVAQAVIGAFKQTAFEEPPLRQ